MRDIGRVFAVLAFLVLLAIAAVVLSALAIDAAWGWVT